MRKRTEKTKKAKGQSWSQRVKVSSHIPGSPCFVCDEDILGRGVPLLMSNTSHSKTGFPTKIGQLMGDGFMVVVAVDDMLCKRCTELLNHLDKLEGDLLLVKNALVNYLKIKYRLVDDDQNENEPPVIKQEPTKTLKSRRQRRINTEYNEIEVIHDTRKSCGQPFKYEYINEAKELELSGSDGEDGTGRAKRVNVEIILDETHAKWRAAHNKTRSQPTVVYTCDACEFESEHQSVFQQHREVCKMFSHKCTICGKKFESNRNVQNHIMKAHLSKWTCHFCGLNFNEETEFMTHMKIHLGTTYNLGQAKVEILSDDEDSCRYALPTNVLGNYECNICDFQSNNKVLFDDHVRKHVVLKLFKCDVCNKRFEDKATLTEHGKNHELVYFKCGVCSVAFEKKSDLMEHLKTHDGSKESDVLTESLLTGAEDKRESDHDNVNQCDILIVRDVNGQDEFLSQSEMSIDNVDLEVNNESGNNNNNSKTDATGLQFHTCTTCSLTFVNDSLFEQHMKSHDPEDSYLSSASKDGNTEVNECSDAVPTVDPSDFVESVMEDSLEDVFEKMHAQPKPTTNKSDTDDETNAQELQDEKMNRFMCDICNDECSNDVDLQLHKASHNLTNHTNEEEEAKSLIEDLNQDSNGQNSVDRIDHDTNENCALSENKVNIQNVKSIKIKRDIGNEVNIQEDYEDHDYEDSLETIYDMVHEKKLPSVEVNNFTLQNTFTDNMTPNDTVNPSTDAQKIDENATSSANGGTDNTSVNIMKAFVCAICRFRTSDMTELRMHFRKHKEENNLKCNTCNKILPSKQKLTSHMKMHNKFPGKVTCPYCYEELADKFHLQQHLQEEHQKDRIVYQCQFCNKKFPTKKSYKTHEETHPERFIWKCDGCDQTFMKEKQLKDHQDLTHRDPRCRFCGKEIMKLKTLRNHELRHMREKDSYECDVCKRVFKTKTGLRHHVAVHTGEYKYCCDYCGRGFMSRMMMEEHRSMHTKEERYICDVCGRKFSFQSTYWIHRKWHDNPYPYKCSFCGRMFRHSSLLAVHKRKHTGERPYKCPHCPLTFPVGGTLKRHLILHTGVYPFNCDSCKRGFTTRHKYATHLAKIHGDFEMLNAKAPQSEFKMVIRDEPREQDPTVWQFAEDSQQGEINFKLEVADDEDNMDQMETGIPCSIVSDDLLENMVPTRVVEIVLDEASQAVATVTLADPGTNMLPELWYQ